MAELHGKSDLAPALLSLGVRLCRNCTRWKNPRPCVTSSTPGYVTTGCERCRFTGREDAVAGPGEVTNG